MPMNKTIMTAAVYTISGKLVNKYESIDQAAFAAKEKDKEALRMGLNVRYEALGLGKAESE